MTDALDTDGVIPMARTVDSAYLFDVVFVHGLGGGSHSTWANGLRGTPSYFFWPEQLAKSFPKATVWCVGYEAKATFLALQGMSLEKRAGNLAHRMRNVGLGDRPIIFIVHSMGGLVLKQLLVDSGSHGDDDRMSIANAAAGIVFCGTPHHGSAYADAADRFGKILDLAQEHVLEMKKGADRISLLHDKFVAWHRNRQIKVLAYAENQGPLAKNWWARLTRAKPIVPRHSASIAVSGSTTYDVDRDHFTLVKPSARNDEVYMGVARFIASIFEADADLRVVDSDDDVRRSSVLIPRKTHLTVVSTGLDSKSTEHLATLTLLTDEPDALAKSVAGVKNRLTNDILVDRSRIAQDATLTDLLANAGSQPRLLDWLAVAPFSAHLYFLPRTAAEDPDTWPPTRINAELLVVPLIHRLSDKSMTIERVASDVPQLDSQLESAINRIQTEFHRSTVRPAHDNPARNPSKALLELAQLVLQCSRLYLANPNASDTRAVFAHVRTRLKYASNVATGQRHTRDENPLP